jgi:adenylate cyclase
VTAAPASILVVDDDAINRMLLTRDLEQEGHRVATAEDGVRALEALRAEPFDIVLLDVLMPELDGFSVLEHIKSDSALQHLPVIMISAIDEIDSVVRCIEMGAEDYLPKPFDPVLLRARINAGLAKKRLHELEQERVRGVFSRFVPEHVVEDVLARADSDLRLGGSRDLGTVMFTDIRGFTAFSESTPPQRVIELLNEYFGEMIDAIFAHGGTLVGYRGDGILAVFGAPIEVDDHADRALAAAREMLELRLPRFNYWLRDRRLGDGFAIGIGLNSGHFMSGNVGSTRRLEYTVHGDTVNTAARLEEMTKSARQSILIAESTRTALLSTPADLAYVGEFEVRGRQSRIRLWTLASAGSLAEAARAQAAPEARTSGGGAAVARLGARAGVG